MTPLRSGLLTSLPWAEHGFGRRQDGAWTPEAETARVHQVHAAGVITVATPGHHGDGDTLITMTPGLWLEIRTADCVPLLIADRRQKIVAAVHAGWRGTAARIAAVTVERMVADFGSRADELVVAIGPGIAPCCFEVSEDVAAQFAEFVDRRAPKPFVDLKAANRVQLLESGVAPDQIDTLAECTACDAEMFHSFRRDRGTGRMVSAIRISQ